MVTSDQHLGYQNSNSKEFLSFLNDLAKREDVTDFVILGDFIDMWRRDISGLFLEHHDILEKILELKKKMNVHCIAGNHDFHLLKLVNHRYPLQFTKDLSLPSNGITYVFKHGWEFDPMQHEAIMEILCYNISDEAGQIRTDIWHTLATSLEKNLLDKIKDFFTHHKGKDNYLQNIMLQPDKREISIGEVEHNACKSVKSGEILIFGHTHRPFVNTDNNVVNSGSWITDAAVSNIYVELDGKNIHLMQYGGSEITQREACS